MNRLQFLPVGLGLACCASLFGCAALVPLSSRVDHCCNVPLAVEPIVLAPQSSAPVVISTTPAPADTAEMAEPAKSPTVVAPVAYAAPVPVPSSSAAPAGPASPGYLQQGPVFAANGGSQAPRALAEQILALGRENKQLKSDLEQLRGQLGDLRKEIRSARELADRSERACEATKRELVSTRGQLEDRQLQLQRVLERMQGDERTQLKELDEIVLQMQSTLRKYEEGGHDDTSKRSR